MPKEVLYSIIGINLLGFLLFERRTVKENMLLRVFTVCIFIIEILIFLIIKADFEKFSFRFDLFFREHKIISGYLLLVNIITIIFFAVDKIKAVKNKNRIKIVTLLGLSFIGGSLGALLSMFIFRHKIRKNYFTVGVPMMILSQVLLLFYVMNLGL